MPLLDGPLRHLGNAQLALKHTMRSLGLALAGLSALAACTPKPEALSAPLVAALPKARFDQPFVEQRAQMVARFEQILRASAPSADIPALRRTLDTIGQIPREQFVLPDGRRFAYLSSSQQIGYEQTISDPYIVAVMTAALDPQPGSTILDIGTGSGYQAAVLAHMVRSVYSIEIVRPLALQASNRLRRMGYTNVTVRAGDGFDGWPQRAPFDGIIVAAGAAKVPRPLLDQLKPGGRIVMPIGANFASEQILVITKQANGSISQCSLGRAMFVDLTGRGRASPGNRGLLDRSIPLCYGAPIT